MQIRNTVIQTNFKRDYVCDFRKRNITQKCETWIICFVNIQINLEIAKINCQKVKYVRKYKKCQLISKQTGYSVYTELAATNSVWALT